MNYQKALEFEEDRYYSKILEIANNAFNDVLRPFLIEQGWDYITGNGTYWIGEEGSQSEDVDKLPKNIRELLRQEVRGYNQDLGCFMPDFSYLEYQCNEQGK